MLKAPYWFAGLGVIVAVALLALLLERTALSPEEARAAISHPESVDWMSIEDDPDKPIEINWMPLPRFPNGQEGAYAERELEERFNVDIKPILLDIPGYGQRKPMLFAAGEIPDVIWNGNPIDVQRDIFHGTIRPIPRELIKKHAPRYYQVITEHAPVGWLYADYAGQNWGLPMIWAEGGLPAPGVWRKDWLDAVGIEKEPQTMEEFHEAFRRFTFDDPDGNGIDDTYGLTNTNTGWHMMFSEFFGAYGVLPFDWVERDGKIVWGGITPEAKQVLGLLRQWYEEGIIDPEWVTDDLAGTGRKRLKEKIMSGRIGYAHSLGIFQEFDAESPNSLVNVLAQLNPSAQVVPAAFPAGPDGQSGNRVWGKASNVYVVGPGVIEEPLKLIRLLKLLEYQLANGEDTYLQFSYGQEGLHWDYALPDDGSPGTGRESGIRRLEPYALDRDYQREVLPVWGIEDPDYERANTSLEQRKFDKRYRDEAYALSNVIGRSSMVPSSQQYLEDLRNWQLIVYTEIITGEKPLAYFDTFVEEWLARGGAQMTAEAEAVLQRKQTLLEGDAFKEKAIQ